jgi:hypothetical protein
MDDVEDAAFGGRRSSAGAGTSRALCGSCAARLHYIRACSLLIFDLNHALGVAADRLGCAF